MTQEITKYDPSKLMDAVRDRIKAEFVGLIPDTTWHDMVKAEVDGFFRERAGYATPSLSPFREIVYSELKHEVVQRLKAYFGTLEWLDRWDSEGKPLLSEGIEAMLISLIPQVQKAIFGEIAQQIVSDFASRIRSY